MSSITLANNPATSKDIASQILQADLEAALAALQLEKVPTGSAGYNPLYKRLLSAHLSVRKNHPTASVGLLLFGGVKHPGYACSYVSRCKTEHHEWYNKDAQYRKYYNLLSKIPTSEVEKRLFGEEHEGN